MARILKVLARGASRRELMARYPIVEPYASFVVLRVPERDLRRLSRRHLVEDLTPQYTIRVADRVIRTAGVAGDSGSRAVHDRSRATREWLPRGKHHYLVEFIGPIKRAWLSTIRHVGGEIRAPFQNFTYVVRARRRERERIRALAFVRGMVHLPYWARIASELRRKRKFIDSKPALPHTQLVDGSYTVEFFGPDDARRAIPRIRRLGLLVLSARPVSRLLIVQASEREAKRRRQIETLATVHGVRSIRERSLKRTSNNVAVRLMGTKRTLSEDGPKLSGAGEIIAICDTGLDTGDARTLHPDFRGRVVSIRSHPIAAEWANAVANPGSDDGPADRGDGHGTHVAGSALGDGRASLEIRGLDPIRGLAPAARLFFQAVEQEVRWLDPADGRRFGRFALAGIPADWTELLSEAYEGGARIHSNSWGGGDPGAYDAQCDQLDRFVWKHRDLCVVCAVGNDAVDRDGNGKIEERSVTSPATAKNCVSVGACESRRPEFDSETYGAWWSGDFPAPPFAGDPMANDPDQIVAFSSRGPTLDGRVKPDVVAPGTFILSTRSSRIPVGEMAWAPFARSPLYFHMGGTSMATPLVAGALALIREYLREKCRIASPSAALLKAALIAGAERIGAARKRRLFDVDQGFGRVDLDAVLAPEAPASALFHPASRRLSTGESHELELDVRSSRRALRVVLAYTDYPGKSLVNNLNLLLRSPDGGWLTGNAPSGRRAPDARNNVEVVHVPKPAAGTWTVTVSGANVPEGPQDYALVAVGDFARPARPPWRGAIAACRPAKARREPPRPRARIALPSGRVSFPRSGRKPPAVARHQKITRGARG